GRIDADDPFCPVEPTADDGAEPDEARTEYDARRAGLDPRGVQSGAQPRGETAGEDTGAIERSFGSDLRERDLGHDRVLRERGRAHEMPDRLALAGQTRR